ncbi:MAG: hypothetical protein WBG58_09375 [Ignavibacteriaceae bacterium]
MELSSITAAVSALAAAKDALSNLVKLKIDSKSLEKVNEALEKLGGTQDILFKIREELFKLQDENRSLKEKIENMDRWYEKVGKYELVETYGGAVVHKFKGEPLHYICPSCIEKKEIHILQDRRVLSGTYDCPNCGSSFPVKPPTPPTQRRLVRS